MKEALKLALDLAIMHHSDGGYAELRLKVRQLAKEALAQDEQSSSQEIDWKDQYEKQKRRAEMWRAKLEEVVGPLPYAVPLAQPEQEPVAIYRAGQAKGEGFHVEFLKEMGDDEVLLYTAPPKRPWVGLTDEQREECTQSPFTEDNYDDIEAKLKELNT